MTTTVKSDPWAKARAAKAAKAAAMAATVTDDEEYAADAEGVRIVTEEVLNEEMANAGIDVDTARMRGRKQGQVGLVVVTHDRPDMRTLFKKTPNGWMPVAVSSSNVATLLREGKADGMWRSTCGDCGRRDHGDGPNDCPGRDPIAFRICPVCGARVWDNYQINSEAAMLAELEDEGDPNLIRDPDYTSSTPVTRTKAGLDRHMWIRHPAETAAMGIAPLPEPSTVDLENKLNQLPRYGLQAGV